MTLRMDEIRTLMEQHPDEPFPKYALALESKNRGFLEEADRLFVELVQKFPAYVPTYLMYGQMLLAMKRPSDARAVFEKGLVAAEKAGNHHARNELAQALYQDTDWEDDSSLDQR